MDSEMLQCSNTGVMEPHQSPFRGGCGFHSEIHVHPFTSLCYFNKSRPTIIRMIWFVPSRMEWTRKSRQNRSMG